MSARAAVVARPDLDPDALSRYFRVLGDPTRLRIVEALLERERNVSELVDLLGASPSPLLPNPVVVPCTHLQLKVLRRPLDSALPAAIGMMYQLVETVILPCPDRLLERIESEICAKRTRRLPADDHASEHIE